MVIVPSKNKRLFWAKEMKFLNDLCGRPDNEKPIMILPVGHPSDDANIPKAAKFKKPLNEILTVL